MEEQLGFLLMRENAMNVMKEKSCFRTSRRLRVYRMSRTRPSLIRRVRDPKDGASWQEFVHFYEPLLRGYVRARGLPRDDVPDVVQEIFIKLLRAMPTFSLDQQRGRFRTWLYEVTMNVVRDRARRKASAERSEDGWWTRFGKSIEAEAEPREDWTTAHLRRALELAQDLVKPQTNSRTWYCYEQRFLIGRSCADIAAELEITPNAVSANAGRVFERVSTLSVEKLEELDHD
jgi:RNA polymerase sigma-70 factor (ECF subfamily)